MQPKHWILLGALLGGLGVALGAFGAHGLPAYLEASGRSPEDISLWVESYETAVRFQMYHAPVVVLIGLLSLARPGWSRKLALAGWLFVAGVGLFSGFLYAWVLTAARFGWMVHIVPIGGVLLITAWIMLAVSAATADAVPSDAPRP